MRVVLIGTGARPIPPPGYGGVERTIAELARALSAIGVSAEVMNEVHPGRTAEYRFARRVLARRSELDGAIVHASTPVVGSQLRRLGIPYVYTTHSRHWFAVSGATQRWGLRLERRAVSGAQCFIALTSAVRSRVVESLPDGSLPPRTETIGLGVDLERFSARSPSGDPKVALGVGAILPLKRWAWAADALRGTDVRLRLVGPPTDPACVRELSTRSNVELVGEVGEDALREEYERASLLIHPSAAELFPGVVAQAMACGRPVIGMPAVAPLVDDGVTGIVVPEPVAPGRAVSEALAAAVQRLTGDESLRIEMGRAARSKAEREFDWRKVALAHRDLYASVASVAP